MSVAKIFEIHLNSSEFSGKNLGCGARIVETGEVRSIFVLSTALYGACRTRHRDGYVCGSVVSRRLGCGRVRLSSSEHVLLKAQCAHCTGMTLEGA